LGIFETSGDLREIEDAFIAGGDEKANLAMEMYVERIAKTIASYAVSLGGIEAIAFTAGVGENS
jgi:acetate kinase